jgi:preprotein translocase subunit YajC
MKKIFTLSIILFSIFTFSSCSTLVNINSEPQGAQVIVDGKMLGKTPVKVEISNLAWAEYRVVLTKEGYNPVDRYLIKEVKILPAVASVPFCFAPWPLIWVQGPQDNQFFILQKTNNSITPEDTENTGTTVYLHDGGMLVGRILSQDETRVTIKTKYTTMTIEKEKIKEIKHK